MAAAVGSYDNFNALQAQKYYEWAVSDPRIIGALTTKPRPSDLRTQRASAAGSHQLRGDRYFRLGLGR